MAAYYADASVLIKRHLIELGSSWFTALVEEHPDTQIVTSRLSTVEVVSGMARRVREGQLALEAYRQLRDDFLGLCKRSYLLIPLTDSLLASARSLLERHPLRAYDALHLAAALAANTQVQLSGLAALTFLAADTRLLAAASAAGLAVENPNDHP